MCACVCSRYFARHPRWLSLAMTSSTPSPPSTTIASRLEGSPTIVQLHASGPTGKVCAITALLHVDAEVVKPAVEIAQRRPGARAARDDVSDQNRVRAELIFVRELAIEMCDRPAQDGSSGRVDRIDD